MQTAKGLALVIASAVLFSTAGPFMHVLPLDAWSVVFWRSIFAACLFSCLILLSIGRQRSAAHYCPRLSNMPASLLHAGATIAFISALKTTNVAHVALIYACLPLLTALLFSLLWRHRVPGETWAAGLGVLAGIVVMVEDTSDVKLAFLGDGFAFAMTVMLAAYTIVLSKRPQPSLPVLLLSSCLSAAISLPFAQPLSVNAGELSILFCFAAVQAVAGMALFARGAAMLPPPLCALAATAEAPIAPALMWLCFSLLATKRTAAGGAIVLVVLILHLAREARHRKASDIGMQGDLP